MELNPVQKMDFVNPNNERELLNASISNVEEMLDELATGLHLAEERQLTLIKTGDIKSSVYADTKEAIEDLKKEIHDNKVELKRLRDLRAKL